MLFPEFEIARLETRLGDAEAELYVARMEARRFAANAELIEDGEFLRAIQRRRVACAEAVVRNLARQLEETRRHGSMARLAR